MNARAFLILMLGCGCGVLPLGRGESAIVAGEGTALDGGSGIIVPDAGLPPDAGAPLRTVQEDVPLFGSTSVGNLLLDPLLRGVGESGLGFLALSWDGTQAGYAWSIPWERTTPSGTSGTVVLSRNERLMHLVAMFSGGRGPFHAEVWAAVDVERGVTDAADLQVQVGESWFGLEPGEAVYTLPHLPADDVTMGGVRWHHFAGILDADLPPTCTFVVSSLHPGADLRVAGPQVVPLALRPFLATTPHPHLPRAAPGTWSPAARAVLARARDRLPTLDAPRRLPREPRLPVAPAPTSAR